MPASTASARRTNGPSTCRATSTSARKRRGIGGRLYQALFRILTRQGFTNAFSGIALPNAASVEMHESVGFTALGRYAGVGFKQGLWHDTVWMQRKLALPPARPEAPRPLAALSPREIEDALAG
jgi:phosphinothricin acetyltransferase